MFRGILWRNHLPSNLPTRSVPFECKKCGAHVRVIANYWLRFLLRFIVYFTMGTVWRRAVQTLLTDGCLFIKVVAGEKSASYCLLKHCQENRPVWYLSIYEWMIINYLVQLVFWEESVALYVHGTWCFVIVMFHCWSGVGIVRDVWRWSGFY